MSILQITTGITGEIGINPRLNRIIATDNLDDVTSENYLIRSLTPGQASFLATDFFFITYSYDKDARSGLNNIFIPIIDGPNITLQLFAAGGGVILPVIPDNFAIFANPMGAIKDGGTPGQAAFKNVSDNAQSLVASVNPGTPFTPGDMLVAADNAGSILDVGLPPGEAAFKGVSDNTKTLVASINGATVVGHVATYSDILGTIQDGGPVPVVVSTNEIYISNLGNDTTGDGTVVNPYLTLTHAISTITTNSALTPYLIKGFGVFTEANWNIKPWVFYDFEESQLTITGSITLDASWTALAGVVLIENLYNASLPNFSLDFSVSTSAFFQINNMILANSPDVAFIGSASGNANINLKDIFSLSSEASLTVNNAFGSINNSVFNNVTVLSSSNTTDITFSVFDTEIEVNLLVQATGSNALLLQKSSSATIGTETIDGATASINYDVSSFDAVPTLVNSGTYTIRNLADGLDAGFTPIHYTPTGTHNSVKGHLQGIDVEIGNLDILTTKGDLLTRDATMNVRLPVGPDGSALGADSTQPFGIAWQTSINLLTHRLFDAATNLSLDWENRQGRNIGAGITFDWQAQTLNYNTGGISVDWDNHFTNDNSGNKSLDWSLRELFYSGGIISVNWQSSILNDSAGANSLNYSMRQLYAGGAVLSADWHNRELIKAAGTASLNWEGSELIYNSAIVSLNWQTSVMNDSAGIVSVNWQARNLKDSSGVDSLGWQTRQTFDSSSLLSQDWNVRHLVYSGGIVSQNWQTSDLFDNAGGSSLNYTLRRLFAGGAVLSADWQARHLVASDGTTVSINYSNPLAIDFSTTNGLQFEIADGGATSVNYVRVNGSTTGNDPIISVTGSDTDVGMEFLTKGNGGYSFIAGNGDLFNVINPGGTIANQLVVLPSITGNPLIIRALGTDPNVSIDINGQGTGPVNIPNAVINGVAVTGTPSVGQVPTATSPTTATWQTPTADFIWNDIAGNTATLVGQTGVSLKNAGLTTATLPVTCAFGAIIEVAGDGAGGWTVLTNGGQNIIYGNTVGTTSLSSTGRYDTARFLCTVADTTFQVLSFNSPIGLNIV